MTRPIASAGSMLSPMLMLAIVSVLVLPPEHVHRAGVEGRSEPLVHAHVSDRETRTDEQGGVGLGASHGDHRLAVFLSIDFLTVSSVAAATAAHPIAIPVSPSLDGIAVAPHRSAIAIHGPPLAASITRGPPSLP